MSWDDPQDWIKLLTPKLTMPADNRIDKSPNTLNDALESLYPRRWSSEATPKEEVKPLDKDVVNYLKEQRVYDSEESLYDYGIRVTKEGNDLYKMDVRPEPMLRILYRTRRRDNLVERHAKEWVVGDRLQARWGITEDMLRGTVLVELPVYKMKLDETSFEPADRVSAKGSHTDWGGPLDPLSLPTNWWFKREDVEFYELLHPEICGPVAHLNSTWVTPSQLILGLKISLEKLLWLAAYKGLRPYMLTRQQGLRKILPKYIWFYGFTGCLFNTDEALRFVRANPDLYGLRKVKE